MDPNEIHAMGQIGGSIVQMVMPIIMGLVGMALTRLTGWIRARTHNTTVVGAMSVLSDLVTTVVRELEQTTVATLRNANGKLDAATAAQVKQSALQKIQLLYGPAGLRQLAKRLGTSEDAALRLIGALIEQAVWLIKNPPPPPPPLAQLGAGQVFDVNVFGGMTPEEKAAAAALPR